MALDELKERLARIFLGRVNVHSGLPKRGAPEVISQKRKAQVRPFALRGRRVSTYSAKGSMNLKVKGGAFPWFKGGKRLEAKKAILGFSTVRLFSWKVDRLRGGPIIRINLLETSVTKDLERVLKLPQERANRLSYSRGKLKLTSGEVPLAFFYPLIQRGVDNSILNKEKGVLLVWYNRHTRAFSPRGLLLARLLGREGGLRWRWTEIN